MKKIVALLAILSFYALSNYAQAPTGDNLVLKNNVSVEASSQNGGDVANNAIDGNLNSRWQAQNNLDNQYIIVDLGKVYSLTQIVIRWEDACARQYTVDVSTDKNIWNTVSSHTEAGGNVCEQAGNHNETITGIAYEGRYIRVNCIQRRIQYGFSIWEIEAYDGKVAPPVGGDGETHLPIVYIDTRGTTLEANKNEERCDIVIMYDNGALLDLSNTPNQNKVYYQGYTVMNVRGQTSTQFPKKPYALTIYSDNTWAEKKKVDFFDMGKENDWILYAAWVDKSLLRNKLVMDLHREMGHYNSDFQYCELYMKEGNSQNYEYRGVYLWMEKLKEDKNRIVVQKTDENDPLNTGYIFKLDKIEGNVNTSLDLFRTTRTSNANGHGFEIVYPKAGKGLVAAQKNYLRNFVENFENTLSAGNYETVYKDYIDLRSFVDYFIIQELSKNADGYRISVWFTKDKDQKLKIEPLWDFELGFFNAGGSDAYRTYEWLYQKPGMNNEWDYPMPFWWGSLMGQTTFRNLVATRWNELRQSVLSSANIMGKIDASVAEVSANGARERNFEKWSFATINNSNAWGWSPYGGMPYLANNYEDEITYLKTFITNRLTWMDNNMSKTVLSESEYNKYCIPPADAVVSPALAIGLLDGQFEFRVSAVGDGLTYQWQKDGENIAGATGSTLVLENVSLSDKGEYACIVSNYAGKVSSKQVEFYTTDNPGDIVNMDDKELVKCNVYPNPTSGWLQIEGNLNIASYTVYDMSGRLVLQGSRCNTNNLTLDISDMRSGIYKLIVVDEKNNSIANKIIKY